MMLTKNFWRYNFLAFRVAFTARKNGASIEDANREAFNAIVLQIVKDSQEPKRRKDDSHDRSRRGE